MHSSLGKSSNSCSVSRADPSSSGDRMNWGQAAGWEDFGGMVQVVSQGPRRRAEARKWKDWDVAKVCNRG